MKVRNIRINLDPAQQRVVDWNDGPLCVPSIPGSGKTACIVQRIARMVRDGIRPESILATTFTKKAAEEMNNRLGGMGINTERMSVQTMHSFCFRLLKKDKKFQTWTVDDKDVARNTLRVILGYKDMKWNIDISLVEQFIAMCRNSLVEPEESRERCRGQFANPKFAEAYFKFHQAMEDRHLLTFDDMLYYGVLLLQKDQETLSKVQSQYRYVIVDEAQDSNYAQIMLGELVAAPEYNYMIVADDDQSLYGWRGAKPEFVLEFAEKYGAETIILDTNYRSMPSIVDAARKVIENNEHRIYKDYKTSNEDPARIEVKEFLCTDDEAAYVAEEVLKYMADGMSPGQMFVLMRTNAQSRAVEETFIQNNIPFVVLGSVSFYERKHVADLLAYLRLVCDPKDVTSGQRALSRPFRFVSRQILDAIAGHAMQSNFLDALHHVGNHPREFFDKPYSKVADGLIEFASLIQEFKDEDHPSTTLARILRVTDFENYLVSNEGSDTVESSRLGDIAELKASASRFNTIKEYIAYVDRQIKLRKRSQIKTNESRVQIMSCHRGKGLESTVVFLIGANDGIMPHAKCSDVEEERRIFYVAMTRAKQNLHITYVENLPNGGEGEPSPFIMEAGLFHQSTRDDYYEEDK